MPQDYDNRRRSSHRNRGDHDDDRGIPPPSFSPRKRERSRSPVQDERAKREAARRAEMERLRAENEEEERRLASFNDQSEAAAEEATARPQEQIIQVDEEELEGLDEEEQMRKLLGIEGFGSTKGAKVETNHNSLASGAASKNKKRTYRQYMNRKAGFNQPLDKMD